VYKRQLERPLRILSSEQHTFPCCVCCSDDKILKGLSSDGSRIAIFNLELGGNPQIIGGPTLPPPSPLMATSRYCVDGTHAVVTEFVAGSAGEEDLLPPYARRGLAGRQFHPVAQIGVAVEAQRGRAAGRGCATGAEKLRPSVRRSIRR